MKMLIEVVLYNLFLHDSQVLKSIQRFDPKMEKFDVLIYDNSSEEFVTSNENNIQENYYYYGNGLNDGLSVAYNFAKDFMKGRQYRYLMLCDQDTKLSGEYLNEAYMFNRSVLVPTVLSGNEKIGPRELNKPFKYKAELNSQSHILSINSGTVLSIETLSSIQYFNEEFNLDYLDNWLFFELNKLKINITVTKAKIWQNLSVKSIRNVSMKRYKSIINSEYRYYRFFQKEQFNNYKLHMALRVISLLVIKRDLNKSIYVFTFFLKHLAFNKIGGH